MATYLRKATLADLPVILTVIADGRTALKNNDIPQWQNGDGPNETILTHDIQEQNCYVLMIGTTLAGVGVFVTTIDDAYETMYSGHWQVGSHASYCGIHRIALAAEFQGQGLSSLLLNLLITAASLAGFHDLRIDTHEKNTAMQHIIEKIGFTYCGNVRLPVTDGERLAYQLLLS